METQFTVRLPVAIAKKVQQKAKSLGLKRSDILRMALSKLFDEDELESTLTPYDRVKHLVGTVKMGVSDLGKNHRNYLIKKIKHRDSSLT